MRKPKFIPTSFETPILKKANRTHFAVWLDIGVMWGEGAPIKRMRDQSLSIVVGITLLALGVLVGGCAKTVGVRNVDIQKRFEHIDRSALNDNNPSERTNLLLRRYDLDRSWKRDPKGTILLIDNQLQSDRDREKLFALMELSYIQARRSSSRSETAARFYLSCAVYAYNLLFDPGFGPPASPYHPHSRDACEFYNRSLASVLIYLREKNIRPGLQTRFPLVRGELVLVDKQSELKWSPEEFDTYSVAYEYEVLGLQNHYQSYGIGVPVILVRTPSGKEVGDPTEKFLPKFKQTYSATAFARFEPFLSQATEQSNTYEVQLLIIDPIKSSQIEVGNRSADIEADFTTALAYLTTQSTMPDGITGLLDAASWRDTQGLHMLQPYQKDKIPVVFVHGLMSSPITWLSMFNDLIGNPVLRKNYQFWFFMYPTGNPIMYSASVLRESLLAVRSHFDSDMANASFKQMVLVGHSMGGVISRQMIIDSGNHLWKMVSDQPFEEVELSSRDREKLERVFFFDALPFVSRVIYIAAPHRGSEWADHRIGRLGSSLVKLPVEILSATTGFITKTVTEPQNLGKRNKTTFDLSQIPTGVDGLSPTNPMFAVIDEIPMRTGLPYHSIMGNTKAADTPGGSDGIVPYDSSYLEGAVSEKIVHSDHSAHQHPLAILELQRILLLHLQELGRI